MEELEKNETSTQAEENTVSLASAQALADALAKIEAYTPTTWVDNSSPDIDAEHLNKPEQAIKRVTDALNSAVDVIKDLQSQVTKNAGAISDVNNNLSNTNDKVTQLYSDLPIIGKFTNKKNKDIIKIGSVVKSRSVVCVFPRYNTLTTVRCIYPSLEISAGEDQFQLFAWDTNTQNDSTSTNLEGYYIVMPMLSK
jgi:hypothetical protein